VKGLIRSGEIREARRTTAGSGAPVTKAIDGSVSETDRKKTGDWAFESGIDFEVGQNKARNSLLINISNYVYFLKKASFLFLY